MSFNPRIGTITEEQLKLLGVCNEIFPALLQKPGKLETNPDRDFQIAFKENYSNYLCDCFTSKIDDKSEDYLTKVAVSSEFLL